MSEPLLFRRYPELVGRLPWLPLATVPTPVVAVRVPHGGREVPLLVKRDDLSAQPYGGNKVRKLEFLLAEAKANGARRVVTAGAYGSHHALATTVYGIRSGLAVSCVLFPQHRTPHVLEVLRMIAAHGAELCFTRRMEGVPFALRRARWRHRAERACIIPPGGSNALGSLGFVNAALELDAQIRAGECAAPASIHVAAGTLGTVAGLALGLALAGRRIPIRAARITSPLVTNERALRGLIRGAAGLLREAGVRTPDPAEAAALVQLTHDQIGAGYGHETEAGRAATASFAAAGLHLDATYTAKAAAALLAQSTGPGVPLFWHTLSAHEPLGAAASLDPGRLPRPFAEVLRQA